MSWSDEQEQPGALQDVMMEEERQLEMPDVKLFNKWSLSDVEVSDISLAVRIIKRLCRG